ncbi:MAG: DUF885 family protein [Calditrichaeota bacterium]|nr:MAG: DUF885 family protein [Calditrichota bacterium]
MKNVLIFLLLISIPGFAQNNQGLQQLSEEFWAWRVVEQPATGDDIPRVERPDGWVPDYSPKALQHYHQKYLEFKQRLEALPRTGWSRSDSVDYLLLRSAIERVNWELNVLRWPHRNPDFYVHQTLGAVYELLLIHTPMTDQRARNILLRLQSIPKTVQHAKQNLTEPVAAFADIALRNLKDVHQKLHQTAQGLKKIMVKQFHKALDIATEQAAEALEDYARWLQARKASMSNNFSVGRKGYEYFLKNIALMPYTPEELLKMGALEWNRSVAFHLYEKLRNADVPKPGLFTSAEKQIAQSHQDEEAIRRFLEEKNIMAVPDWMRHYINKKIPDHIRPLAHMGVIDDLTSPTRLDEDGVSYIPEPSPDLPFFRLASAQDPRPIIVHEGVPGHYFQLVRSWKNPDPIRRHYYDSGANEGIGFYVEELMLQFGLFDDRPHTREIIYRFMRLRALRVDVDVNLALGNYTIEDAARYLAQTVPMDYATALQEAGFFALTPGQAISYQIGKLQILKLIADAKIKFGDKFNLKNYHDYMMVNGNVPIALQRWEYLGLRDEIDRLW